MIDSQALLRDLQRLLKMLEDDLRVRVSAQTDLGAALRVEWQAARDATRTGETFESWHEEILTQAAAHWILAGVFVRFVEDNSLVDRPFLAGPGERLALARDRHEVYFRAQPLHTDREYLLDAFHELAALPGMGPLFDERHNPLFRITISGDAAMSLLAFWQKVDPDTGQLVYNFNDPSWNTRFLGDLYQDLSAPTRKRFALLQTPEFVEEFILDRTLTPAIAEFGYREVRLIDPTCGSGHFTLGAFHRLFDIWARNEPGRNARDLVQRALDGVFGVDLNPFAVAIARFRLLIAAIQSCGVTRLAGAPDFRVNLAVGDSLLHGTHQLDLDLGAGLHRGGSVHAYTSEDLGELNRILGQRYHAVVGNPPYITVKDPVLNKVYRELYSACHMKYSLGVPFTQRFFDLAISPSASGDGTRRESISLAGYVGMITANSFMKREFGKKLIEEFFPQVDLTHVIDTAGAYIPGHGTPTVILFGRHRPPVGASVRAVMGIRGEPSTPDDPAQGQVWRAILDQVDRAGSECAFVSVADVPRATFAKHPWSIGGGGAAELKEVIESRRNKLGDKADSIGITSFTLEDEVYIQPPRLFTRRNLPASLARPMVVGDAVRDWSVGDLELAIFPYDQEYSPCQPEGTLDAFLWCYRTNLSNSKMFGGKTKVSAGLRWFEYGRLTSSKLRTPLSITLAFVATHNHLVLDRGGKVFNRSAPVIKLQTSASEDEHLGLLGLLNSSLACFWLKQGSHNKGSTVDDKGARQRTDAFEDFYEFTATGLGRFPLTDDLPVVLARLLDCRANTYSSLMPTGLVMQRSMDRSLLNSASEQATSVRRQMIALQEELDWECYRLYGLIKADGPSVVTEVPEISLGERAFEIVMARQMATGDLETTWFTRHGSTPITEIPAHWPDSYRQVVEQRLDFIENDRFINLIERPEYKRRWVSESWEAQEQRALRGWLLDRLENPNYWPGEPRLTSVDSLADVARSDQEFMRMATLYAVRDDFDVAVLVGDLVATEAVPFLPVLRYAESGMRKREQWERTWELQRLEDAIDAGVVRELPKEESESDTQHRQRVVAAQKARKQVEVGDVPVPPKYQSKDFLRSDFWRLRGGLDVQKERFVSYPGCARGADGSLPVTWAGWDHLQQATALSGYYLMVKDNEGWEPARLQPLLAGLQALLPWLRQWHNEYDPVHATRMGDYFAAFVADEARTLGFTLEDLRLWQPPTSTVRRGRRRRDTNESGRVYGNKG